MSKGGILSKVGQYPVAVACVVIFGAMIVLVFLRGDVVDTLSTTEEGLSSRLGVIKSNQDNAPGLPEEVEALEASVERFKERLFDREQRAINTDFFYNMEDSVDVRILEVSQTAAVHEPTDTDGPHALKQHEVIVFNVSIRGTFRDIVGFFRQLHRVEPFVRVSDFEVRSPGRGESDAGGILAARLQILVLAEIPEDES